MNVRRAITAVLDKIAPYRRLHGINHVGMTVTNFEEAVRWYNEMFDFHLVNELWLGPAETKKLVKLYGHSDLSVRLGFMAGQSGCLLELFEFTPSAPNQATEWTRAGFSHAALSVSNVPEVKKTLEAKGVEFVTDVQFTGGAHWAFMKDPDGNLIEIIDYHANRLPLALIGNFVGRIMARTQFKKYY